METGTLIIYRSTDDCETWVAVKPADVPEWAKDPDVIARMVDGEACQNDESEWEWFIALRAPNLEDVMLIAAAKAKRLRRATKRQQIIVEGTSSALH